MSIFGLCVIIASTSYRIQLGLIKNKWAIRLLKGSGVVACYIFRNIGSKNLPEGNQIISWILYTVPLSINPHQIWMTVQVLLKQVRKYI